MRAWIWLAGLLGGLAIANTANAQFFGGTSNSSGGSRIMGSSGQVAPTTFLSSPFRLRDLFPSLRTPISTRQPIGYTKIPDPNSPEYLKAFGFRRLQ